MVLQQIVLFNFHLFIGEEKGKDKRNKTQNTIYSPSRAACVNRNNSYAPGF